MPWFDPTVLGSLIGVAGGLVGVVVGGWVARSQYRTEYDFRKRNALRAIMIEMTLNQSGLALDLDRVLPAWLARSHLAGAEGIEAVRHLLAQSRGFESRVYDALFADVVVTEFGSEVMGIIATSPG